MGKSNIYLYGCLYVKKLWKAAEEQWLPMVRSWGRYWTGGMETGGVWGIFTNYISVYVFCFWTMWVLKVPMEKVEQTIRFGGINAGLFTEVSLMTLSYFKPSLVLSFFKEPVNIWTTVVTVKNMPYTTSYWTYDWEFWPSVCRNWNCVQKIRGPQRQWRNLRAASCSQQITGPRDSPRSSGWRTRVLTFPSI